MVCLLPSYTTLNVSNTEPTVGSQITAEGRVTYAPFGSGVAHATVNLYINYEYYSTTTADDTGRYVFQLTFNQPGKYVLQVKYPGWDAICPSDSPAVTVNVVTQAQQYVQSTISSLTPIIVLSSIALLALTGVMAYTSYQTYVTLSQHIEEDPVESSVKVAANNERIPIVLYGSRKITVYGEYDFYVLNVNGTEVYATHSIPESDTDLYYSTSLKDIVIYILKHYADENDIVKKYNVHVNDLIKCIQNDECKVSVE